MTWPAPTESTRNRAPSTPPAIPVIVSADALLHRSVVTIPAENVRPGAKSFWVPVAVVVTGAVPPALAQVSSEPRAPGMEESETYGGR